MIETIQGDVLSVPKGIIVHGCNTFGVMGAGVALQVRIKYPGAYQVYLDDLKRSNKLGEISVAEVDPDKFIVNALTQAEVGRSYRMVSYDAVVNSFEKVVTFAKQIEKERAYVPDIVFPAIGSVLGGGDWEIVKTIIDRTVPDSFKKIFYLYK